LVIGVGMLLLAGVAAIFTVGRVHLAKAQAQAAADTAAVSAGRRLAELLPEIAADGPTPRRDWRRELARAAGPSLHAGRARLVAVRLPGTAAWPPTNVEVVVERPGPMGTRVSAAARAGLTVAATMSSPASGWAQGGGYDGPLVYRDGKPLCPAVAAAMDPMVAAARADGFTLTVVSGFRSDAEQAILFARHPDPKWVARPGQSRHRDATEIDFGGSGLGWLAENATRFGFLQRYSWEPWHYGFVAGCGGSGAAQTTSVVESRAHLPDWVPTQYRSLVTSAALANGIAPTLLAALLQAESGYNPRALSPVGAQGIAQFMPGTALGMGLADPFDPTQAIPAAARLLAGHIRSFGSAALALAAYNAGPGAVQRYGGIPPYAETQAYVARILSLAGGGALVGGGGSGGVTLIRMDRGLV
jgi:hypothetical protein